MTAEAFARSSAYVEDAMRALPGALEAALRVRLPDAVPGAVITTGIGASEGPARILASRLANRGLPARFLPLSRIGEGGVHGALLVAFSQGASPNACHALGDAHAFAARWLLTSVDVDDPRPEADRVRRAVARGVVPVVLPPGRESGALVRLVGPTVATLVALRLEALLARDAALDAALAGAPARYEAAAREGVALPVDAPFALVTAGPLAEETFGIRWALMEALLCADPPVWDVLAYAHGPLQATATSALTLLVLESPRASELVARLERSTAPRHRCVRLLAQDDALGAIDLTARFHAVLRATLRTHPRDLFSWPGRGEESALYRLGDEPG